MSELNTAPTGQMPQRQQQPVQGGVKFCQHCGKQISKDAVLCIHCGCQVEALGGAPVQSPNIIINNNNVNQNTNTAYAGNPFMRARDKWVAVILCLFLGFFGAHKFYEGKAGMGVLYLFTGGLFLIGVIVDLISLLCKPNPYYVHM